VCCPYRGDALGNLELALLQWCDVAVCDYNRGRRKVGVAPVGSLLWAVAVGFVCVAILFAIESPTQDVSTVQPEETPRAQREDTPSPTPPPDDPFSTSSIDLVMGSPIQDCSAPLEPDRIRRQF
jgi:hypothetical protein